MRKRDFIFHYDFSGKLGLVLKAARTTIGIDRKTLVEVAVLWGCKDLSERQYTKFEGTSVSANVGEHISGTYYYILCQLLGIDCEDSFRRGYCKAIHLAKIQDLIYQDQFLFPITQKLKRDLIQLQKMRILKKSNQTVGSSAPLGEGALL